MSYELVVQKHWANILVPELNHFQPTFKSVLNNLMVILKGKAFILDTIKSYEFCSHNGTRKYTRNVQQPTESLDICTHTLFNPASCSMP